MQGGEEAAGALAHDDEVEFGVVVNRRSGSYRAEGLALLCRAEERRELGQARNIRLHVAGHVFHGCMHEGTLQACSRVGDLPKA